MLVAAAVACRSLDVVVLPGGHEPTQEFVGWAVQQLGLAAGQVLFTPGSCSILDDDISSGEL
jgi:hypothetical protein